MWGMRIHKNKSLTIGVDARPLIYPFNGNAQYLHKMLRELILKRPNDRWILFSHRPLNEYFSDLYLHKNVRTAQLPSRFFQIGPLWIHFKLIPEIKKYKCDLLWATLAMLPFYYQKRTSIPALVNFHDLNAFSAPGTMTLWNRWQHKILDGHTLKNARSIICLSKTTEEDIIKVFPSIPRESLQIVYPGCELPVVKARMPELLAGIKNFILSVGTIEPRKNHKTLISAYLRAKASGEKIPPLVLVGKKGWGDETLYQELKSGKYREKGILYLDHASMEELIYCYKNALFCALPSLHEGFGLPVIEALSYGKLSVVSDIPVFREVCRECKFVPPEDIELWSDAIVQISRNKKRPRPSFNRKTWSWKNRAAFLSEIIDSLQKNQGI